MKTKMHWYHYALGSHVHVRVFFNGAHCGNLCFTAEEFADIHNDVPLDRADAIEFIIDTHPTVSKKITYNS